VRGKLRVTVERGLAVSAEGAESVAMLRALVRCNAPMGGDVEHEHVLDAKRARERIDRVEE